MNCKVVDAIKDYVEPLMQVMTNDFKKYNMRLTTTKCLNTAILLSIFLAGQKSGEEIISHCDSHATKKRHEEKKENNKEEFRKLKTSILRPSTHNYIYYILMSDRMLKKYNTHSGKEEEVLFPGHVFLIEKIGGTDKYRFYQSYINKYTLFGHYEKNNFTMNINKKKLGVILDGMEEVLCGKVWTSDTTDAWEKFTFVKSKDLENADIDNKIFLCYKCVKVDTCIKHLDDYLTRHIKVIPENADTYGDPSLYRDGVVPLSNNEIKKRLKQLQKKIQKMKIKKTKGRKKDTNVCNTGCMDPNKKVKKLNSNNSQRNL